MSESFLESENIKEDSQISDHQKIEPNPFKIINNKILVDDIKPISIINKFSPLPKPDFSSIEKKESNFIFKERGSYKKPKSLIPESPMKSPNQKFFTPVKLQSNLFGNNSTCRKLNFTEICEPINDKDILNKLPVIKGKRESFLKNLIESTEEEENENKISDPSLKQVYLLERFESFKDDEENENFSNSKNIEKNNFSNNLFANKQINFIMSNNIDSQDLIEDVSEKSKINLYNILKDKNKFDQEYEILKTLESGEFGVVYKCLCLQDQNIYAIKKTKKIVGKTEYGIIKHLIIDLNLLVKFNNFSNFVVKYKEAWMEEGHLLIKQEYCKYGDLLDFLEKLEENNFTFTPEFYWDIIFEMICYIHLDIKPSNFFIGDNGCLKLGDFNLSRKKNKFDDDYFEGDSTYMAPEILEANKIKEFNEKCDIFSLGLTISEILCKIELPQNGILWRQIRSENFSIPKEFLNNSNIKIIPNEFLDLIHGMINYNPKNRLEISQFFEKFDELNKRLELFKKNKYTRSFENFLENFDRNLGLNNKITNRNSYL